MKMPNTTFDHNSDFIDQLIKGAGRRRRVDQGRYLFHQGDPVGALFIIAEGLVELTRYQRGGPSIILQRAARRTVLAEASIYAEHYHCDGRAAAPSIVYEWPKAAFVKQLQVDGALAGQWAAHLAHAVQAARYRSEILARRTIAERLDGWLAWQGDALPAKGQWKSIAAEIGVSPEAFYRELAKRRA
jgi:CRP-like cAMP-binding protein